MTSAQRACVIGAGVVGVASALHLQRSGFAVTLLDATGIAAGCSFGNAGGISPGAIVPAATPGLLSSIPKWLVDRRGPLSLHWRHLPRALPWLLQWVAQGTPARRRHNARALAALNSDPYTGYRELLDPGQYADLIRTDGQLLVWRAAAPADNLAKEVREQAGIEMRAMSAHELSEFEPGLSREYRKGLLFPGNGFTVNPERLVQTMAANFAASGGKIMRRRVVGFDCAADGPRALQTDEGALPVERIVLAAGAWSARLARELGVAVPMEAERGYHVTLLGSDGGILRPVLDAEQRFMATPMEFGIRVAGTVELAGVDAPPDYRRSALLLRQVQRMLPSLRTDQVSNWMGMRPSMPDSVPVIDRHPAFPRVLFAFGHGHLGLSGAPATGKLVADLMADRAPSVNPEPFRLSRFRP